MDLINGCGMVLRERSQGFDGGDGDRDWRYNGVTGFPPFQSRDAPDAAFDLGIGRLVRRG